MPIYVTITYGLDMQQHLRARRSGIYSEPCAPSRTNTALRLQIKIKNGEYNQPQEMDATREDNIVAGSRKIRWHLCQHLRVLHLVPFAPAGRVSSIKFM